MEKKLNYLKVMQTDLRKGKNIKVVRCIQMFDVIVFLEWMYNKCYRFFTFSENSFFVIVSIKNMQFLDEFMVLLFLLDPIIHSTVLED